MEIENVRIEEEPKLTWKEIAYAAAYFVTFMATMFAWLLLWIAISPTT